MDEKGETARYTLAVDGDGQATIALVSFPESRLGPEERAVAEPPCRAFLDMYRRAAWKELHAAVHPALRGETTLAALEAQLGSTRASMLETMLREKAADLLGEPVTRLAAPLERLERVGDAVLGTAVLTSGREVPVRVEQSGRSDDFEVNDFRCQILDAPWLIRKSFASRSLELTSVDCPSRVVPDDGSEVCHVQLKTGERYAVTIHRRGGEHRVTAGKTPER